LRQVDGHRHVQAVAVLQANISVQHKIIRSPAGTVKRPLQSDGKRQSGNGEVELPFTGGARAGFCGCHPWFVVSLAAILMNSGRVVKRPSKLRGCSTKPGRRVRFEPPPSQKSLLRPGPAPLFIVLVPFPYRHRRFRPFTEPGANWRGNLSGCSTYNSPGSCGALVEARTDAAGTRFVNFSCLAPLWRA